MSEHPTSRVFGIDLGTTNSVVAEISATGRAEVLPNDVGDSTTPSVVAFDDDGGVLVGREAESELLDRPDTTLRHIKRQMGRPWSRTVNGTVLTPEIVSGIILRALLAPHSGVGAPRALITVPAYFGTSEREATAQAARLAGIELLGLVQEPVAAAVFYGVDKRSDGSILVYDLGGGTFDVSILRLSAGSVEVSVTDGDSELGGVDWDDALGAAILAQLDQITDTDALLDDDSFADSLSLAARQTKERLSAALETQGRLLLPDGTRAGYRISRDDFEEASRSLLDRTMAIVDRTLARHLSAGRPAPREVLLVGGSTRMPAVRRELEQRGFTVLLTKPDHAVALGAALKAAEVVRATAVLPRGLGILVHDSNDPEGQRTFVHHLVRANTPLPAAAAITLATCLPDQAAIRVQIWEQAGDEPSEEVGDNRRVLDGEFHTVPGGPAGTPVRLTLHIDGSGTPAITGHFGAQRSALGFEAFIENVADEAEAAVQGTFVQAVVIR